MSNRLRQDVADALTWDELADEYKKRTGRNARIQPMEKILKWAEKQPGFFYDNEGYLYLETDDE